nr:MAG TPA: hypothetical protein [Caudoviricetes sp.]
MTCCANEIKRIFAGICVYQHSISVNQAFSFQNHPKNSLFIAQFPLNLPPCRKSEREGNLLFFNIL